jgi:hypothetical protein
MHHFGIVDPRGAVGTFVEVWEHFGMTEAHCSTRCSKEPEREGPHVPSKPSDEARFVRASVRMRFASWPRAVPDGVQEPAWSPDGKRIAVSYLDRIWTMTPEASRHGDFRPQASDLKRVTY